MPASQAIKVQHGCGCLSGCATVVGALILLGPFGPLLDWAMGHVVPVMVLGVVGAVLVRMARVKSGKA